MFCLSGLGYIVGTTVAGAFHDKWQWGLRVRYFSVFVCFSKVPFCFSVNLKEKITIINVICTSSKKKITPQI